MKIRPLLILISMLFFLIHCSSIENNSSNGGTEEEVDLEKLIGTPFEGMTIGDNIGWCHFQEGEFVTLTVPSFPIPIFLAFFTPSEEEVIRTGIQLANDAAEFEIFSVIEEWSNETMVIYKVSTIFDADHGDDYNPDAAGTTIPTYYNSEGKNFSDVIVTDWQIEILDSSFDSSSALVIAHELGHALGIFGHALIDYDDDVLLPLEEQSIMSTGNQMNDYGFMMKEQVKLYLEHAGEEAANPVRCL